ncbi:hypothetical protein ACOME3_001315 [Neoechinorhynchus agilis]
MKHRILARKVDFVKNTSSPDLILRPRKMRISFTFRRSKQTISTDEWIEQSNVRDVYEKIAESFSSTRRIVWPIVLRFLESIADYSLVIDIGCGNGKNMVNRKLTMIGCDVCEKFCKLVSNKNGLESFVGDCVLK